MAELVEFKAGRLKLVNGVLVADSTKGLLKWLVIISFQKSFTLNGIKHFIFAFQENSPDEYNLQWFNRDTQALELVIFIFFSDLKFLSDWKINFLEYSYP
jgi:hypothetical protein